MQEILGLMRKAITDYNMLSDGDRVLVGVSGGKDSVLMMTALAKLRKFIGIDFEIIALTLNPNFDNFPVDYNPIEILAQELGVTYICKNTDIGEVVFNIREEKNPCSLCARMRRGAMHDVAKEYNCNKVALGHHADDAVETFIMNLFNEGRVGCFSPVTYMSRKDVTVIRPLIYATERDVVRAVRRANLPVIESRCPVDKKTNREATKLWLENLEKDMPGVKKRIYGAIKRGHVSGW